MSYDNIDSKLKEQPKWVLWTSERKGKDGELTKVPRQISGSKAATDSPNTWTNYQKALQFADKYDGLGYILCDGYIGIDLDHCWDPESSSFTDPIFEEVLKNLGGYKEYSPGGDGVHVIIYQPDLEQSDRFKRLKKRLGKSSSRTGFKLEVADSNKKTEVYWNKRFFTMTGNTLPQSQAVDENVEVDTICDAILSIGSYFGLLKEIKETYTKKDQQPIDLNDQTLVEKACNHLTKGTRFTDLLNGSWEQYAGGTGSQSSADMTFMNDLAYWSGKKADQMERIFRSSGLYREEKGDSYLRITIDKAIDSCNSIYDKGAYKEEQSFLRLAVAKEMEGDPNIIMLNEIHDTIGVQAKQPSPLYKEVLGRLALKNNKDYKIFMVGGGWSYLQEDKTIEIDAGLFRALLSELGEWKKYNKEKVPMNEDKVPDHILNTIPSLPERLELFPELRRIINFPILREDNTLVTKAGYDEETCTYILEDQNIEIDESQDGLEEAIEVLQRPFEHFQFVSETDRANAWAFFFTILCRDRIKDNIPFFGFKAPSYGIGKGLLLKSLYGIIEDRKPEPLMWPQESFVKEDKIQELLAGAAAAGYSFAYFDNVPDGIEIRSPGLAAMATEGSFSRVMKYENIARRFEADMVIAFTGNNVTFGTDLARRNVTIEITADTDKPEDRVLPDLKKIIQDKRNELLSAAMTILWHWQKAGAKKIKEAKGSFEDWSRTIGGILSFMGIEGFNTSSTKIDGVEEAFRQLISEIWNIRKESDWMSKEVFNIAFTPEEDPSAHLPGFEDDLQGESKLTGLLEDHFYVTDAKRRSLKLGRELRTRCGRRYTTDEGTMVELKFREKANPRRFYLEPSNSKESYDDGPDHEVPF